MLLLHQLHRRIAQLRRVIDRRHPRLGRKQRARLALIVNTHVHPQPRRFLHARLQLRLGVLIRRVKCPELRIPRLRAQVILRAQRRILFAGNRVHPARRL